MTITAPHHRLRSFGITVASRLPRMSNRPQSLPVGLRPAEQMRRPDDDHHCLPPPAGVMPGLQSLARGAQAVQLLLYYFLTAIAAVRRTYLPVYEFRTQGSITTAAGTRRSDRRLAPCAVVVVVGGGGDRGRTGARVRLPVCRLVRQPSGTRCDTEIVR